MDGQHGGPAVALQGQPACRAHAQPEPLLADLQPGGRLSWGCSPRLRPPQPQTHPESPPKASQPSCHCGAFLLLSSVQGNPHPAASVCGCPLPACCWCRVQGWHGTAWSRHSTAWSRHTWSLAGQQCAKPPSSWGGGTVPSPHASLRQREGSPESSAHAGACGRGCPGSKGRAAARAASPAPVPDACGCPAPSTGNQPPTQGCSEGLGS